MALVSLFGVCLGRSAPKIAPKIAPKVLQKVLENLSKNRPRKIHKKCNFGAPKWTQNGSKIGPKCRPKWIQPLPGTLLAQDGAKMAPRCPKMAQDGPKMAPRWSTWPKMAPRWPQDGPRCAQDGPRWPQVAPRWPHDGPKVAPRWPKDGPKMAQARGGYGLGVQVFREALARCAPALRAQYSGRALARNQRCVRPQGQ